MNKNLKRMLAILLSVVLVFAFVGCSANPETIVDDLKNKAQQSINGIVQDGADAIKDKVDDVFSSDTNTNEVTSITNPKINITMLDVGQGLSILIESNGEYLLYDGGDRETSSYVVSYLSGHEINKLDYIVASHYDSDHIAGLVGVLETTDVDCVINPSYKVDTKIYQSYVTNRDNSGAEVIYPEVGDAFTLGYSTITVLAPAKNYGDSNEMSVAIKITCDEFDCIITGDAEGRSEADMLNCGESLDAELYIVGHHGSSSSSSNAFVKAISPEYAFISCGKDNDYGHPHDETMATLNKYNVSIYRSDKDGEVTCSSNGVNYAFSKDVSYVADNTTNSTNSSNNNSTGYYILNISSMKFHLPDCESVAKMSEKNKQESNKTREELINAGYSVCGYCNP